jgi:chromosome segregation ATPase
MGVCVVSIKGPKSKDGDLTKGKRTEPSAGGSNPGKTPSKKTTDELTGVRPEPIFQIDPLEMSREIRIERAQTDLDEQIGMLKSQVDSINNLDAAEVLSADQSDVLRKYISLKDIENRDLKDQLQQYQAYLKRVNQQSEGLEGRQRDLIAELETLKRREESARIELKHFKERQAEEIAAIKGEYEERLRRSGNYEAEVNELVQKREQWRERVKQDLNRIKLKERELENRYELLKRDMQALLDSKDKHVLELKKRTDAQDLELESLEEKLRRLNRTMSGVEAKKRRLIETLRLALALLDNIDQAAEEDEPDINAKRNAG